MSMKPAPAPKAVETAQDVVEISVAAEDGAAGKKLIKCSDSKIHLDLPAYVVWRRSRYRGPVKQGFIRLRRIPRRGYQFPFSSVEVILVRVFPLNLNIY